MTDFDTAEAKFNKLIKRLAIKIGQSQTPVPGFAVGLSGTDSALAFLALNAAIKIAWADYGLKPRLMGIHYVNANRLRQGAFEKVGIPWLRREVPEATIQVIAPPGGNHDQYRWADLHVRALKAIDPVSGDLSPLPVEESFWVSGTINATEHALGKYSLFANAVSIQPIRSMWKSEIMALAKQWMPEEIVEAARIPDCLCGRDEVAAENIELVDAVLRNDYDPSKVKPKLLKTIVDYIRVTRAEHGFRSRIPYVV
ncbi:NAD synthetase [Caulobacter phage CcrSC]|uniref:Uncharacterized protein n=1 Tax=Caulobacter phage CcrSC TaxID=2283272 RepID=A0A385EEC1_9CAUD|nr:NAD synthetase [Caulobacter phage CcrSC]AXQ70010.1 hypothetical protein CcrSC_gp428 [Caulobacter phage CcrSC]